MMNRLSTSSSLSIITPPTTPKRPSSSGRLKMAFSLSLAQNFNQKLASLNDKWNDFSFILKSNPIKGAGATRNDSYHSIESAVTCTAADLEAGNFSGGGSNRGDDGDERFERQQQASGQGGSRGLWNSSGSSKHHQHHRHHQKPYERHKQRLTSPRRNSTSGDPKEFDMLVLKAMDNGEDNESF